MKNITIERMDIAARAIAAEDSLPIQLRYFVFLTCLTILLALTSHASHIETLAVRSVAATYAVVTLLLLANWRYAFHAEACAWIGIGIAEFLFKPEAHTALALIARLAGLFVFTKIAFHLLKQGRPFATVHSEGWQDEHSRARRWFEDPASTEERPTFYIPTGSFWTGYFTYRLGYFGDFWTVAKFKTNSEHLLDFRVLEANAIRMTEMADGKIVLYINNKKIRNADPKDQRESLVRLGVLAPSSL
jgi:hypothetical protein